MELRAVKDSVIVLYIQVHVCKDFLVLSYVSFRSENWDLKQFACILKQLTFWPGHVSS